MPEYGFNVFWSDEDEGFIATCPDFPGLSAFGETQEEALVEAKVALEGFIEISKESGNALPEPTQISSYSGQTRLRMPKSLHAHLAQNAQTEGMSLNAQIVWLLTEGLSQKHSSQRLEKRISTIENQVGQVLDILLTEKAKKAKMTSVSSWKNSMVFDTEGVTSYDFDQTYKRTIPQTLSLHEEGFKGTRN
ncbi:type II toxin-antitoxin system HicB family antitoxin [Desulfuromonas sp.]|uniref:type II toxin-antitoxin system HicB family antitoxin n=1 Tax=Desulfuromonas sp. TaxID=892 RepID=UPI0025B930C2|nr:type II toxin-antitoxin system HicB family antitoxin [Desulfuromonas sp.]